MKPKVSIIINCFNGEKYLREAIESIYSQTFHDWEIIFWDNDSSDGSRAIAEDFDEKLKYFRSKIKTNLSEARQNALQKCQGDWIAFLDTDDFWYPDKLKLQIEKIENTDYIVCYGGIDEIDESGKKLRTIIPPYRDGNQLEEQLNQFNINMVTPLIKKSAIDSNNIKFDPKIVASEEYNIFLQLACFGDFCTIREPLGVWRIQERSLTSESSKFWALDRRITLEKLKEIKADVIESFPKAYKNALARTYYYEARHFYSIKQYKNAQNSLSFVKKHNLIYFSLWIISFLPFIWNLFHNEFFKRNMSSLIFDSFKLPWK